MTTQVEPVEAKARSSELLDKAADREDTVITRAGLVCAWSRSR